MALLQVEYRAAKLRGLGRLSFIRGAHWSSIREYCLSSLSISLSERVPSTGKAQYRLTRASMQMIAENIVDGMIKAGDFSAFLREWAVDLFPMSSVSDSMVILYTLQPDLKAYVEDLFENATGLVLSSLLARMRCNLSTWYSAIPSCPIFSSNSGSFSSFSKIDTYISKTWRTVTYTDLSVRFGHLIMITILQKAFWYCILRTMKNSFGAS